MEVATKEDISWEEEEDPAFLASWFPSDQWISTDRLYLHVEPQGTKRWKEARGGLLSTPLRTICCGRVTASNFGAAVGHCRYTTPAVLADELAGLRTREISRESQERMDHGSRTEPLARAWYQERISLPVSQVGLAVPKWNLHLGSSLDGAVGNEGILEIKCPQKMYAPLLEHKRKLETGWRPSTPFYRSHLWRNHYDQMQGSMAIWGRAWCDYVVYSTNDQQVYWERIPFHAKYWNEILYPGLQKFLSKELFPRLH